MAIEILDIRKHPMKSARGSSVKLASVDETGIVGDRSFVVILDDEDHNILTQRNLGEMAQITAVLWTLGGPVFHLELSAPGMPTIQVPSMHNDLKARPSFATVFGDRTPGWDCGDNVAAWLTMFLKRRCRLVQRNYVQERETAKPIPELTTSIGFQDRTGILVIGFESIEAVTAFARRTANPHWQRPPINWRMTWLVWGARPFAEHFWREIVVKTEEGSWLELQGRKRCDRCGMPDRQAETGALLPGPPAVTVLENMGGKITAAEAQTFLPLYPDRPVSDKNPKKGVLGMGFLVLPTQPRLTVAVGAKIEVRSTWPC